MFKNIIVAALLTLPVATGVMASTNSMGEHLKTVSVSGASSVDEVIQQLNEKAQALGADSIKVTSVGGQNKMFGTAVILK